MAGEGFEESKLSESFQLVIADSSGRRRVTFAAPSEVAGILESLESAGPDLELLEIVLDVRAEMPSWLPSAQPVRSFEVKPDKTRLIRWSTDEDAQETPVAKLEDLDRGAEISGPAVIEAMDTIYAVKSGWTAQIDGFGNVVIELTSPKGGGPNEW
jgi:N-methylhydantoinase A/oxoprolinase/acetone carboxylase beta subunit